MGRRQEKLGERKIKCFSFLVYVLAIIPGYLFQQQCEEVIQRRLPSCQNKNNGYLVLISTLDGRLTALNVENNGAVQWSLSTGSISLLSSSISKIELYNNGVTAHLIPSLDGNIFKYNGNYIEPLPFAADSLLSNTHKLAEDLVIAGGKDLKRFAINPITGKIRYKCTSQGCQNFGSEISKTEDLLLVERFSQTIRALDSRNGAEKWNFSVGQHELNYVEGLLPYNDELLPKISNEATEDIPWNDNIVKENDVTFDISIPDGSISAIRKSRSSQVLWTYTFESPVADAWLLKDGELKKLNSFHGKQDLQTKNIQEPEPLFYFGYYKHQPYIQTNLQTFQTGQAHSIHNHEVHLKPIQIRWKPYLVTASSRTPFLGNEQANPLLIGQDSTNHQTALVTHGYYDYPYDYGFYLFSEESIIHPISLPLPEIKNHKDDDDDDTFANSIWTWWKEVLAISVVNALIIHIIIAKYFQGSLTTKAVINNNVENFIIDNLEQNSKKNLSYAESIIQIVDSEVDQISKLSKVEAVEYVSRYLTDFNPHQCLGKGGFGIVVEACNKLDDCCYAIKRICLPNRDDAREKVMREVKALAKLDHIGIVRYFQAWFECPPPGWQEEKDKEFIDCDSTIPGFTSEEQSPLRMAVSNQLNPLKPFSISEDDELLKNTISCLSLPMSNSKTEATESGSFSIERENRINLNHNGIDKNISSLDLDRANGNYNSLMNNHSRQNTDESVDIIFEDSGCADHCNNSWPSQNEKHIDETDYEIINVPSSTRPNKTHSTPKLYLYIQMQLCRKESLKDWLAVNNNVRDKDEVLEIFDQIVNAVEYVHSCGLMHRDLKPSNIFFSLDGIVKVGDFGLVTAMTEHQDDVFHNEYNKNGKKHTDQVGTQLYMSPEQIAGQSYSHKVDIFSLGLIFFELFYPFTTQMERLRTLMDIRKDKFPSGFIKEQSQECDFVKCLLSRDPDKRPSAEEIKTNPLLKDFQPSVMFQHRPRSRTLSSSSSSAGTDNG